MKNSTFLILCLEGALLSFNVAATAAMIPSIAAEFSVSPFFAGKAIWLYMLPYGIAALSYGPLVRIFDAKKVELVCFFFFSLANLLAGLSGNIKEFFIARFLMGIFGASVVPLVLILIAHRVAENNRGRLVGMFFSATFVASLLGLFLSGIIPWRLIYLIPAFLGIILSVGIYRYLPSFKQDTAGLKINYAAALRDKNIIRIFSYIFFMSLFYHGVQQWLAVYFSQKFNAGQFWVSMLITITSLSGIIGEGVGGWLADVTERVRVAGLGSTLMIVSVFLLVYKLPYAVCAIIMAVWGLGWTFNHASVSTMLTDLPKAFVNEAASLNSSLRFISGGLGAAAGGILMQKNPALNFLTFGYCLAGLTFMGRTLLGAPCKRRIQ